MLDSGLLGLKLFVVRITTTMYSQITTEIVCAGYHLKLNVNKMALSDRPHKVEMVIGWKILEVMYMPEHVYPHFVVCSLYIPLPLFSTAIFLMLLSLGFVNPYESIVRCCCQVGLYR